VLRSSFSGMQTFFLAFIDEAPVTVPQFTNSLFENDLMEWIEAPSTNHFVYCDLIFSS